MEPLKIQIEVNLGEKTQETLKEVLATWAAGAIALGGKKEAFLEHIKGSDRGCCNCKEDPKLEPAPAPAPAPEPEPAPADDMPADIADPISDEELINAVAETKKTVPATAIRELFKTYGIPCSTKCPQEKRAALVEDLKKLRDAQ